jgi:hypothetical protein
MIRVVLISEQYIIHRFELAENELTETKIYRNVRVNLSFFSWREKKVDVFEV